MAWVSENADTNGNDLLSEDEIAAVTAIDVSNKGIADLTGIENFKATLQTLNCSFNNLTSLNLQDFTALNSLNCSSNKSMTSLNVKGCEILSTLTCNTCALEGTLDLTENTVLSTLTCSDNPKLTVTLADRIDSIYDGYTGPTELHCNNINSVGPLDTATLGSGLKWLWISNQGSGGPATIDLTESSGVTSLYLNGNPNLTSLLLSSDTEAISTLDISGTKLEPQDIIDKVASGKGQPSTFKAASMVGGMTAGLTDLDVSAFTGLDELDLSGNNLTSVTLPSTASSWGVSFKLNLSNNELKTLPAIPSETTHLYISSNDVDALDVSSHELLQELDVSHNNLKTLDLSKNTNLQTLNAAYNKDLSELKAGSLEAVSSVNISGTKVPLSGVPKTTFFLHIEEMEESITSLDLSGFTKAHEIHASNNKNLQSVILAPNEAGDSHGYYFDNCGLISFDPPAGTCWISLENNQLATLDLSKATHLEKASVKGQTLIGAYVLTPEYVTVGGGSYSLNFDEIVGSSNVSKIAEVTAYDDNGAAVMVNSFSNGVAIFAEAPSRVTYNYMTGGKIAGTEISMDVTLATTDAIDKLDESDDLDGVLAPELSVESETLNLTAGQKMTDFTISVKDYTGVGDTIAWSAEGDLPLGLSHDVADDNRSYTISGTPAASTAGRTFNYTVTAKNSAGQSSATITLVVASGNGGGNNEESTQQTAESIKNMTPEQKRSFTSLELTGSIDNLPSLLEGFTSLVNLNLSGAQIQHVALNENSPVEYISLRNNSHVKTLEVNDNDALEILDFTGSSVETIDTDSCSKLKSLIVRDCTQLRSLSCVGNALTVLDLDPEEENLPNLQLLSCDNQFQEDATFTDEMNFSDFTYEPYTNSEVSSSGYDDEDDYEAEISWSFSKVQNLKAFDSSGKAIDAKYDNTTGKMTFADTPAKITYDYGTGFKNILMDVTVSSASSSKALNSSSSGCNAGLGFMSVFALAGLSALLRKKS